MNGPTDLDPIVTSFGDIPEGGIWDAVVVGAGPAGSMTALEMGRRGCRVLLLDRARFPRWKVCGATLSPGVVDLLEKRGLGHLLDELDAQPLRSLRLGGWSVGVDLPLAGSMALSRRALDAGLIQESIRCGVPFQSGVRVRLGPLSPDKRILEVSTESGETREISARLVVAADGLSSRLMAQAGEPSVTRPVGRRRLVGLGAVVEVSDAEASRSGFEGGKIHMAVGNDGYVGAVRDEAGLLNLAAALDRDAMRRAESPGHLVWGLLQAGGWQDPGGLLSADWTGTPELTRRPSRPGSERLLAVGDASGYVEPFTGEGILWALSGGRALAPLAAKASASWDPSLLQEWARVHSRLIGRAQRACRAITWTLARPGLSRAMLKGLRIRPSLAAPIVRTIGSPLLHSP